MNLKKFWYLYNQLPGKYDGLKEELVYRFTSGRTTSLRQIYPNEFAELIRHLEDIIIEPVVDRKRQWSNNNLDVCRKRVIASISGYFRLTGTEHNIKTILGTACRHAKCRDFNLIPAAELHRIYNTFRAKQRDCERAREQAMGKLSQIQLN